MATGKPGAALSNEGEDEYGSAACAPEDLLLATRAGRAKKKTTKVVVVDFMNCMVAICATHIGR